MTTQFVQCRVQNFRSPWFELDAEDAWRSATVPPVVYARGSISLLFGSRRTYMTLLRTELHFTIVLIKAYVHDHFYARGSISLLFWSRHTYMTTFTHGAPFHYCFDQGIRTWPLFTVISLTWCIRTILYSFCVCVCVIHICKLKLSLMTCVLKWGPHTRIAALGCRDWRIKEG